VRCGVELVISGVMLLHTLFVVRLVGSCEPSSVAASSTAPSAAESGQQG
jgi:hypothetical protein